MAKFLYSAAMSLDGFIAAPGGDVSWLTDYLGPNPVVDDLVSRTGAVLAGNRTFGGDDPHKGGDGTRLFDHPGGETVRLEQLSVSHATHVTNLWYRVVTA